MKVNRSYVSDNNTYEGNNPQYIVVHNTDNFAAGADANAHARAQYNGNLSTSVHYYTDEQGYGVSDGSPWTGMLACGRGLWRTAVWDGE